MSNSSLRALLAAEHQDALAASTQTKLSGERTTALQYYMGDMAKDLPVAPGRSSAVSMDVSDTVEGMMPQLMDIFTGSDEVVRFEPVGPEDVKAAQQETDYVNHVFMNQNDGFMTLYSMMKDALLSKVGIVKIFWESREEEQKESYYDKSDDEYALLASNPEIEIIEHTAKPLPPEYAQQQQALPGAPAAQLHDVTVVTKKDYSCARVIPVPPEEFGTRRDTRILREASYCFHKVITTTGKAIAQGYDPDQIKGLPTASENANPEEVSRDSVNESSGASSELNSMTREIEIVEHYVRMDYEGKGKANLYRVVTGGTEGEILRYRDEDGDGDEAGGYKEDIQPWDAMPFAAVTPVPQTHRFYGRSIADLVMDIQKIKTALLRSMLDNKYLANNPRVEVAEQFASDNTLDDLLVSRPGGVVRTKQPGGLNWQVVPDISASTYPALDYLDAVREERTGVSRRAQALDANTLANQSATAANIAYSVSQSQIKMIAKIAAETGIKDMFWLLHGTIKKHADKQKIVRLRNEWVAVDPRQWKQRDDLTIHVGLGTGDKAQQAAMLMQIMNVQKELLMGGLSNMVSPQNLFNSCKDLSRIVGKPDAETYFTDPSKVPPAQPQPDPRVMEIKMKADLEMKKAQVDAAHQAAKLQADATLEQQKFEHDKQMAYLKAKLDMAEAQHSQQIAREKAALDTHVATRKLEIDGVRASHQIMQKAAADQRDTEEASRPDPMAELMARMDAQQKQHQDQMAHMMRMMSAPKRIIRHPKTGKAEGVETVLQ